MGELVRPINRRMHLAPGGGQPYAEPLPCRTFDTEAASIVFAATLGWPLVGVMIPRGPMTPRRRGDGMRGWVGLGMVVIAVGACTAATDEAAWLHGSVQGPSGEAPPWATVSAVDSARGVTVSVPAHPDGRFAMDDPGPGDWAFRVAAHGHPSTSLSVDASIDQLGETSVELGVSDPDHLPASAFLAGLPEGEEKRRFILDCTGCHVFDDSIAYPNGSVRSAQQWATDIARMLATTGPGTGFPIISSHPDPEPLGEWLEGHLSTFEPRPLPSSSHMSTAVELTEYDVPQPLDLPHDLMVDQTGNVVVTGMFTHRMYELDPASGAWTTTDIPVEFANPRALEIDDQGRWWVLLGAPQQIAMYEPSGGNWEFHEIGMYPHSIMRGPEGLIWFNGHFSYEPELIASLDPTDGSIQHYEVPNEGDAESTIPYGLRVDPAGIVWATQLRGNRLIRLDPSTGDLNTWTMPVSHSGPRRPDIGPDGMIWIPEYSGNAVTRFDPTTEEFTRYPFPAGDALPYVVRIDQERGTVWVGTAAGDVMASVDPATGAYQLYPLPTVGALIRHLDVDESTGDVWAAYGASPGIPGKILRVRRRPNTR